MGNRFWNKFSICVYDQQKKKVELTVQKDARRYEGACFVVDTFPAHFLATSATGDSTITTKIEVYGRKDTAHPFDAPYDVIKGTPAQKVMLKSVSFEGSHPMKGDDGTDFDAPQWKDNSIPLNGNADDKDDIKYPVCYTRNTNMKISAEWEINFAPPNPAALRVRGSALNGFTFGPVPATIANGIMIMPPTPCARALDNWISFYDPLLITWWYSIDGGGSWLPAGKSSNQIYVTLANPKTTVYHTLAYIGCKKAMWQTTENGAINAIWEEFAGLEIKRVDGMPLKYYGNYHVNVNSTADLLSQGDGKCGAWAKFFLDVLKIHGIQTQANLVVIKSCTPNESILVKNWTFSGKGSSGHPTYPYLNLPLITQTSPDAYIGNTSYNWVGSPEVTDTPGIAGQNNKNPHSFFTNHAFVRVNGKSESIDI